MGYKQNKMQKRRCKRDCEHSYTLYRESSFFEKKKRTIIRKYLRTVDARIKIFLDLQTRENICVNLNKRNDIKSM